MLPLTEDTTSSTATAIIEQNLDTTDLSFSVEREKFSSFIIFILHNVLGYCSRTLTTLQSSINDTLLKIFKNKTNTKSENNNKNKMAALYDIPMSRLPSLAANSSSIPMRRFTLFPRLDLNRGLDVTDNKTNEVTTPQFIQKSLRYAMNDIFHREDERLKTFDTWPHAWLDKYQLAQTGMFYTGDEDKVKCYFCEVEIGRWELDDQPVSEHLRWSPNCPLLRRRTTNNVPISDEALDRVLPPRSYDVCGANDAIEVRPYAYAEGNVTCTPCTNNTSCGSSNYFPEYPEYAIEAARVRSFAEWPRHMRQKPEQLAEAGFFYTGIGDRVKCFSCGGGLKDWDENDEPWTQHALWLSKCRFLKLMKGQSFIDAVKAKYKEEESCEQANSGSDDIAEKQTIKVGAPKMSVATATPTQTITTETNTNTVIVQQAQQLSIDHNAVAAASSAEEVENFVAVPPPNTATAAAAAAEKKSSSTIPEEKLCKICYAVEYNTAFLPCGHVVACAKCASSVTKCPLCRKPFTDVMRVYFS